MTAMNLKDLFEAAMLICFGLSWPLNLMKNIKAGTAKSMSLPFAILIEVGYIFGITAKLISNSINYVLIVYVLNLIFVSANLVVYFINRRKDRMREEAAAKNS